MQEEAEVNMIFFGGVNCSMEAISLQEVKKMVRVLKNRKVTGLDEDTREMIKGNWSYSAVI